MKKYILAILTTLGCMTLQAQKTSIKMAVSLPTEQDGDWVVTVSMDNPDDVVTSMQFDLTIPSDFSYTAGNYLFSERCQEKKLGKMMDTHSLVSTSTSGGGTIRVIVYSNDNKAVQGTTGCVVSFFLSGSGTADPTPCNLTNVVISTLKEDNTIDPTGRYPQPVIGDSTLQCYDTMGHDVLIIGSLTDKQLEEVNLSLNTNGEVRNIDLRRCDEESMGLLTTNNDRPVIICHHKGQVDNTKNGVYMEGDVWQSELMEIDDHVDDYLLPVDIHAKQFRYRRNFSNTDWQALYLPVELPVENLPTGCLVASFKGTETDSEGLWLMGTLVKTGTMSANTPALIKMETTGEQLLEIEEAELKATKEGTVSFGNGSGCLDITGSYAQRNDLYALDAYAMAGGTLMRPSSDGVTLGCFRWMVTTSAGVKPMIFIDETITGIDLIHDSKTESSEIFFDERSGKADYFDERSGKTDYYDLQGRKAHGRSKGVLINRNGKKIWR